MIGDHRHAYTEIVGPSNLYPETHEVRRCSCGRIKTVPVAPLAAAIREG